MVAAKQGSRLQQLVLVGCLFGCSTRLATTEGPFRDVAQPGPCVLDGAGRMQCWGGGQRTLVDVPNPKRLASGGDVVCAEPATGKLRCWSKRLGPSGADYVPLSLEKLAAPSHVASDANGYCALQGDGSVACWSVLVAEPRVVAGIRGARQVDVFVENACALLASGHVACWKVTTDDPNGSLGRVEEVPNLSDARQLALGFLFGCAVLADGSVSCWGHGNMGELGRPVAPDVSHPAERVPGLSQIAQVVASTHTACARSLDGAVRCWGRNMACELGIKKRKVGDLTEQPLVVPGLEPSRKLTFHGNVVCSLSTAENLTCWGGCLEGNDPNVRLSP